MKFASARDFLNVPVRGFRADHSGTAPTNPAVGQLWTDSSVTPPKVRWFDGANWIAADGTSIPASSLTNDHISTTAGIALSKLAVDVLDRTHHTGTQLAATISDFHPAVRTNRLDELTAPTTDLAFGSVRATHVGDPTDPADTAPKWYVDNARAGILAVKDPVRVVAQTNVDLLNPGPTIDGVTMQVDYRFLAPYQSDPTENGIYIWNGATNQATRATDADDENELADGTLVAVAEGTDAGKQYIHFWGDT